MTLTRDPVQIERLANLANMLVASQKKGSQKPSRTWPASPAQFAREFRHYQLEDCHEYWYENLADFENHHKILIIAPREHGKTSSADTYATWRFGNNRQLRAGLVSKTDGIAQSFLRDIVAPLEEDEDLIEAAGGLPFKPIRPRKWTNHEVIFRGTAHTSAKDCSIFAIGVGGQITSRHCDLLLFDDIETIATVQTPEQREKTRTWFAKEAMPVLSPGGQAVVLGTRKHQDDLYQHLIDSGDWLVLDLYKSAYREDGSPLWPKYWSVEALAEKKRTLDSVDLRAWSQEYLNVPLPAETAMFHPEKWPEWRVLPDDVQIYQAWDLAISQKQSADYTAELTVAVDTEFNLYLLHAKRGHWSFDQTQQEIANAGAGVTAPDGQVYVPMMVGVEAVAYQAAAVQEAMRLTGLPIQPLRPSMGTRTNSVFSNSAPGQTVARDKVSRARLPEARGAAGKIYRPAGHTEWWADFAAELAAFPAGAHDDYVDVLAYDAHMALQGMGNNPADAYGVTFCWKCTRGYYDPDKTRACPFCGAKPEEKAPEPLDLVDYELDFGNDEDDAKPARDFLIETGDPVWFDEMIQKFAPAALVCPEGQYVRQDACYILRVFGNPAVVLGMIAAQGYGVVKGEVPLDSPKV